LKNRGFRKTEEPIIGPGGIFFMAGLWLPTNRPMNRHMGRPEFSDAGPPQKNVAERESIRRNSRSLQMAVHGARA
jgi:hypothetical protein